MSPYGARVKQPLPQYKQEGSPSSEVKVYRLTEEERLSLIEKYGPPGRKP